MISYPSGEITPNQFRRLIEGKEPLITYRAYDGSATWHLMGPLAPIAGVQEGVTVTRESIKGFIAPWQTLDQAGANQDGVTFNDAVYGPAEIDMVVEAHGLNPVSTRQVVRDWVASWDAHQQGTLYVFTRENGMWWAPVRWLKAPTDALMRAQSNRQRFVWTARVDDAFWRSWDSVADFSFQYNDLIDLFDYTTSSGLGANWPLRYSTVEEWGYIRANGRAAIWVDDPNDPFFTHTREVVAGPYKNFHTVTSAQVVATRLSTFSEVFGSFNDIWARMNRTSGGAWNGDGFRLRVGWGHIELSRFNNFVKTHLKSHVLLVPPMPNDVFALVAGFEEDANLFHVLRNGKKIFSYKEEGVSTTVTLADSSHRGVGFGMYAGDAFLTQVTPARVTKFLAGDNRTVAQEGFLAVTNVGDVEAWPRFLLKGPGTFYIGNGPGSEDMVEFGPLLNDQVVLLETEPRRRSVVDLSPTPTPEPELRPFQKLLKALKSWATNNNMPPLLDEWESAFGVLPPQGNLYSYLNGRFTEPIPAKSPGELPVASYIKVRIDNANANSNIIAAVTPRRRWPL